MVNGCQGEYICSGNQKLCQDISNDNCPANSPNSPGETCFSCTQVIGFSQTRNWYADAPDFESVVDNSKWQLQWYSGAGITDWANAGFAGWSASITSPCASNPTKPDRIILTITGDYQNESQWWVGQIQQAVVNIKNKYPSARQILLQPVVGGPNNQQCPFGSEIVRASYNHPIIDQAITLIAAADPSGTVKAGFSPEVPTCSGYKDWKGHLTDQVKGQVGRTIGEYYARLSCEDSGSSICGNQHCETRESSTSCPQDCHQENLKPIAMASASPTSGISPLTVQFSSAGSNDPDGTIDHYLWNFGDNALSTGSNPTHIYQKAGEYKAILRVTDNAGAFADASVTIIVTAPQDPGSGCGNNICEDGENFSNCSGDCKDDFANRKKLACDKDPIGEWKQLSNSCGDRCHLDNTRQVCLEVLTMGCDCGPNHCWKNLKCVPNRHGTQRRR